MMPKMKCRPQLQSWRLSFRDHLVANMNRVLQMRQQHAFLDHDVANMISPDREPVLEAELRQIIGALQIELSAGTLFRAKRDDVIVTEAEKFGYVIPHHDPSERSRQSGDEQSMITTRNGAGNGTGGIPAESVGDQPFAGQQNFAGHVHAVPRHCPHDRPIFFQLLVHRCSLSIENWIIRTSVAAAASLVFLALAKIKLAADKRSRIGRYR